MERKYFTKFKDFFPFINNLPSEAQQRLLDEATHTIVKKGTILASEGDFAGHIPFVLGGCIKVYKLSESGKSITLYRVNEKQTCILTLNSVYSGDAFDAFAETEENTEVILVDKDLANEFINCYEAWCTFSFKLYSKTFSNLITLIQEIAFKKVDSRIAEYILKNASDQRKIQITHQKMALDIGTSREVVSRLLKDFEIKNFVKLSRGAIELKDIGNLKKNYLM